MSTKGHHMLGAKVERTMVKGQKVWRVRSAKSGRFISLTTKASSERSMMNTDVRYSEALKSLSNR